MSDGPIHLRLRSATLGLASTLTQDAEKLRNADDTLAHLMAISRLTDEVEALEELGRPRSQRERRADRLDIRLTRRLTAVFRRALAGAGSPTGA